MPNLTLVSCRGCGASLPVDPAHLSVTCAFCGDESDFDPGDLADHRVLPEQAAAAEEEGLSFLEEAYEQSHRPGAPGALLAIVLAGEAWAICCFGAGAVGAFVETFVGGDVSAAFGAAGILAALVFSILPFAILGYAYQAAPKRGKLAAAAIVEKVEETPRKSSCPSCGGPVQVPPLSAALPCASCSSTLLVSRGMLIEWVDDAKARGRRWREDAEAVAREYALWTVRWTNRIGWILVAAAFLTSGAGFIAIQLAGAFL